MNKKKFAALRVAFGIVWAIDAYFKWQPAFISAFSDSVTEAIAGQPGIIQTWINIWGNIVSINADYFAIITAITETAIAIGLIFGILTRFVIYLGITFSLLIWTTAEGFGGPYNGSSTDIGAAIIYVFVFIALLLGRSWEVYSLDAKRGKSA
ncbi:MAG: DoxX family membrane protein [Patescibacteria group bacterium]|nr:DoxX family membrane protein [Patescibacteria group bacterium]